MRNRAFVLVIYRFDFLRSVCVNNRFSFTDTKIRWFSSAWNFSTAGARLVIAERAKVRAVRSTPLSLHNNSSRFKKLSVSRFRTPRNKLRRRTIIIRYRVITQFPYVGRPTTIFSFRLAGHAQCMCFDTSFA